MNLGSCREVIKDGQTGPSDEFLKSMVVPVAIVSSNTFRSIPWWRDANGLLDDFRSGSEKMTMKPEI